MTPVAARPEQVRLSRAPAEGALEVAVRNRIFLGEHTDYLVRHGALGDFSVLLPRQAETGQPPFATGDRAWIGWDRDAARILDGD